VSPGGGTLIRAPAPGLAPPSVRISSGPGGAMSAAQIELDQDLLTRAAAILGTTTKKATVNEALRRVVAAELRSQHVDELAHGALPDLADPAVMESAW
jgi:Arc/MetJ family transcription regulator